LTVRNSTIKKAKAKEKFHMRKLPAVEEAKSIMRQGMEWGVWKWMLEKTRVRQTADQARAALDEFEKKVKSGWSDDLKLAYNQLVSQNENGKRPRKNGAAGKNPKLRELDPQHLDVVRLVIQADDEAYNAHEDAEDVFAEAEERMSTNMAREGARKALVAYDLHEASIRKAEALGRSK
jgi:hypothetical protein